LCCERGQFFCAVEEPLRGDRGDHDDRRGEGIERRGDVADWGVSAEVGDSPAVFSQDEAEAQEPSS
jgi:hypothetical protein